MSTRITTFALLAAALLLCGCDGEFPNQEMDLAGEAKLRPLAITIEPPEAAPGETVEVTLHFYSPDRRPESVDWSVALDYRLGLYETDEVEDDVVNLQILMPPIYDEAGYGTQLFHYHVPEDLLLTTGAVPDTLTDAMLLALVRPLLGKADDEPVTRAELDAAYREGFPPDAPASVVAYAADLFSCEIRFRARLRREISLDVTRNLTVRHSRRTESYNVNTNPWLQRMTLYSVPHPDVDADDLGDYETEVLATPLAGEGVTPGLRTVPLHRDWTYFLGLSLGLDTYSSPFDPHALHDEKYNASWYHLDLDDPRGADPFYVTDEGEEAEMDDLDSRVRLAQPLGDGPHRFRVTVVVRDRRLEWMGLYSTTPGATLLSGEFEFVEP